MLSQRLVLDNGPKMVVFDPVVAGTSLEFALYYDNEDPPDSGTFVPYDFSVGTFVSEVRYSPRDLLALGSVTVVPGDPGWVKFFLPASLSLLIGNQDVHWSCKFVLAINPEYALQLASGVIPVRLGATR